MKEIKNCNTITTAEGSRKSVVLASGSVNNADCSPMQPIENADR